MRGRVAECESSRLRTFLLRIQVGRRHGDATYTRDVTLHKIW